MIMKKIFTLLSAVLIYGVATAQTERPTDKTENPAKTTPEVMEENKKDAKLKRDVITKDDKRQDGAVPRKNQIRTRDHEKSTPKLERVKDTARTSVGPKSKNLKKGLNKN